MKIIVVGGGIGGVAAGAALGRAGATPLVLEQARELTQVGAGVNISANGMRALVHLGADQHVRATSVLSEGSVFDDLETGASIGRVNLGAAGEQAWGDGFYHVHRADLLDALVQRLTPEQLRLGATVASVEDVGDGVVVRLVDGTEIHGDAVVGADGLKSKVRTSLYGPAEARPTGYVAWRALVPAEAVPPVAVEPFGRAFLGPRRHTISYPVSGGKVFNFVGFVPDDEVAGRESWTASGDVAAMRASFAGCCDVLRSMIDAIDEAFITAIMFREPVPEWGTGRIVLLGDAAHPVPPSAAQGACMALEDAVVLGRAVERFGSDGIERAFGEYAARRRPRTNRLFGTAMNNFRMFNLADPVSVRARNGRLRGLERLDPIQQSSWGWLYSYDPVGAIDDATSNEGLAAAATRNGLVRPEAREAFDRWRDALRPTDFAAGERGLREGFDRFLAEVAPPGDVTADPVDCDGVAALRVGSTDTGSGPAVLHLHGGLFTMGSAAASVGYGARLARAVGGWALLPDYRLAPEHEYPAALDDALAAYRWLREQGAGPVVVSGLDAGGGLAVSLAVEARRRGLPAPDGLFVVSPVCDLELRDRTLDGVTDPWISHQFLSVQAASYLHGHDPAEPLISPVHADLSGLPPLVVLAAAEEALAGDARRLADAASAAGVDVSLTLVEDSVHDFTLFAGLPETDAALAGLTALAGRTVRPPASGA